MSVQLENSLDQKFEFKNNLVVLIGTTYFAKYQPDSGLVIDADKLLVSGASINPTQIDLKRATTQINSTSVNMLDGKDGQDFVFSAFIGADENALIGTEISIFFGRVDEALDFSDYIEINKYIISDISKPSAMFRIKAKSQEDRTQAPAFEQQGTLTASITDVQTTIVVQTDEDIFDTSGIIKIGDELIRYSSKAFVDPNTTFTISQRGDEGSTAVAHTADAQVNFVQKLNGNPIDLILQLLISSGGTGVYDVLIDGAGIDESLIDVAGFLQVKADEFPTDVVTRFISNESRLIDWMEDDIFKPLQLRLVKSSLNNLISLVRLNTDAVEVGEIDDAVTIKDSPKWNISKNEIQTVIKAQWNWSEGKQRYGKSKIFKATPDILVVHGEVKGPTLNMKLFQTADNGDALALASATRELDRFSTPKMIVKVDSFMSSFKYNTGDKIRITAKHLPAEGGSLGMSSVLELVKRAVNTSSGVVKLELRATSYTNIRDGKISPADILNLTITDQKTFTVVDGTCYKVGFVMRLYRLILGKWEIQTDLPNVIQSIVGNVITMTDNWTTTLGGDVAFSFADYDEVNAEQKSKYAFIVGNTNFFADGSKGYQVIL